VTGLDKDIGVSGQDVEGSGDQNGYQQSFVEGTHLNGFLVRKGGGGPGQIPAASPGQISAAGTGEPGQKPFKKNQNAIIRKNS
jgi:hypothetical protein